MALTRLRHPLISRAFSLSSARSAVAYHYSAGSPARFAGGQCSLPDGHGFLFRPASLPMVTEVRDNAMKLTWRICVQHFSSAELPPHMVVGMPALSPTMTQGNIAKWRKKEGDKIEVGDILCEIETDKATLEFESLEEGFLAKILAPEGSKNVPVGQPIAITVEDADDIQNVPINVGGGVGSTNSGATNEGKEKETRTVINTPEAPDHIVIQMPALSPTMERGYISHWRVKEGHKVEMGDVLCEIETDKATIEFESLEEGYVAKILAPEGFKDVTVGQPIVVLVEDPDNIETVKKYVTGGMQIKDEKSTYHDSKDESTEQKTSFRRISPAAKLLISEHLLDTSLLKASGPHGTLLKSDVLAAIKSGKASSEKSLPKETRSPSPQGGQQPSKVAFPESKSHLQQLDSFEDFPNTQIRKVIAKRLLESKQTIPHLYLSTDVVLDPLLSFRKELKEKHDIKASVNDIVIKAVAIALRNVPEANDFPAYQENNQTLKPFHLFHALPHDLTLGYFWDVLLFQLSNDHAYWNAEKGEIILCDSVDISIAVATEKGLLTPIVRNADQKSITAISSEVKQLAEKARMGKLAPNEYQGGTFSISNLGMYPVDHFAAIINPPQAGILAVGRGNKVVELLIGSDGIERPVVVNKMNLTLSADHGVFDGKVGGAFLSALRSNFSDIQRLLLL